MKNLISILAFIGYLFYSGNALAGENKPLMAERAGVSPIDLFSVNSVESLLGLKPGEKLASYQLVLSLPADKNGNGEIFKYDNQYSDFKTIMTRLKEHAVPGCILFVDELKAESGNAVPAASFRLK